MSPERRRANYLARIFRYGTLLLPVLAMAQEAPAGTPISVRLMNGVSTRSSKADDPVEAVVIAPAAANGRTVIGAGVLVHGVVTEVAQSSAADRRAALLLRFTEIEIGGARQAILARVWSVDNARETVDDRGRINGILAAETVMGRLDAGLNKLGGEYRGFADILSAVKNAVFEQPSTEISYPPGVEMTLQLEEPFAVAPGKAPPRSPVTRSIAGRAALAEWVEREPFRTVTRNPPKPSDIVNLLLLATDDALHRAFADAGWSGAASLNRLSRLETLRAVVEDRGYSEAPVSMLLLDGKPPDLVFEKSNNTFARRHHVRIWRRPGKFHGQTIWAVAATHDIAIDFSETEHTFIHRIDPRIDDERDKVVDDLQFAGHVEGCSLVERAAVPRHARNATGDDLETDGRIAVLRLR